MQPFSLLIKPAGADCNLRCDYCFYLDKGRLYPGSDKRRMSEDTLEALLRSYLETPQPVYSMVWQGGEPALMGPDFFRRVTDLQKHLAPRGARIANSIQTNGTLVDDGLATHLGRYRFLAGVSIDGPADLHDSYRKTASGRPSHARAVRGMRTLRKHGVPVNALTLVSSTNAGSPLEVYRHLLDLGFRHLQFIPCVENDEFGRPLPFSISGEEWGDFLTAVFNEWYVRGHFGVSVRNFESVLASLAGTPAGECRLCERCDQYLVVEHNGDVFPCDFFVGEEYRLGNVHDTSLADMRMSDQYKTFAESKKNTSSACVSCEYISLCMGDCPKFRAGTERNGLSSLCSGWRGFFQNTKDRFDSLSKIVVAR